MDASKYAEAVISKPPKNTTKQKKVLAEVHDWLGKDSFPKWQQIFVAKRESKHFDRESGRDIKEALLFLQSQVCALSAQLEEQRRKELLNLLISHLNVLNELPAEGKQQRIVVETFAKQVVEEGLTAISKQLLMMGITQLEMNRSGAAQQATTSQYGNKGRSTYSSRFNSSSTGSYGQQSTNGKRYINTSTGYGKQSTFDTSSVQCFECGKRGHFASDCRQKGVVQDLHAYCAKWNRNDKCYRQTSGCKKLHKCSYCHSMHHIRGECPKFESNSNA